MTEYFARINGTTRVTSAHVVTGPSHAHVTVRWKGATCGKLTVDLSDVDALLALLMPGGYEKEMTIEEYREEFPKNEMAPVDHHAAEEHPWDGAGKDITGCDV